MVLPLTVCVTAFGGIAILYCIRRYFAGGVCRCKTLLTGKTVLLTGGSSGIGAMTTELLANRGANLIVACRDLAKAEAVVQKIREKTGNNAISLMKLDLASLESVRQFVEEFKKQEEKLDILINNAGVFYAPLETTEDGFDVTFQVNYLGHFLLTLLLLDRLLVAAPSRIINVSSTAHHYCTCVPEWGKPVDRTAKKMIVYGESKLAQIYFTRELAEKLKGHGISVFALHPGTVETSIFRTFPFLTHPVLNAIQKPLMKLFFKSPWEGAQTVIHCALMKETKNVSGLYFSDCKVGKPSALAMHAEEAKTMWKESLRMTNLPDLDESFIQQMRQ